MKAKSVPAAPPPDAPTIMPAPQQAAEQKKVPVMPLPDDEELKAARKRKLAKDMSRSGRLSTILSDSSDTLG